MSAIKTWLMNLQAMPEYEQGYDAYNARRPRTDNPYTREKNPTGPIFERFSAWGAGWDTAKFDEYMESVNDEPFD